jgi:1-phosphatidylinositol phosphodiesterase
MRSLSLSCAAGAVSALLASGCTISNSPPPAEGPPGATTAGLEVNIDRPGGDYRSFDLGAPRPEECRDACLADPACASFTYVNPGVQGAYARCWLKSNIQPAMANQCCVSGVKSAAGPTPGNPGQSGFVGTPPPQSAPPSAWQGTPPPPPAPTPPTPTPPSPTPPSGSAWVGTPPPPAGGGYEMNMDRAGSDYRSFDLPQPRAEFCRDACMREPQCRAFTYVNPGVQGPNARCWLKNNVPPARMNACCISGTK